MGSLFCPALLQRDPEQSTLAVEKRLTASLTPEKKNNSSSGGEILAETDASGNTLNEYIFFGGKRIAMLPNGGNAQYYVEDLLGTSRVMTTNTGTLCYDADFYPYGGERTYTNSCPTGNVYKFEGKERDTETGNDDFGARYYSNRFGRWLSADWSGVPAPVPYANLTNPQTLNLYAMVSDDPESFADLDGHTPFIYQLSSFGSGLWDPANANPNYETIELIEVEFEAAAAQAALQLQEDQQEAAQQARNNNTVTVTVDQVKSANPYGHAVIQIDGGQKVGFVPDSDKAAAKALAKEAVSEAAGVPMPSPVPGHVEPLAANRTKDIRDTAVLHVTPEQAQKMQAMINDSIKNLHSYDPGFYNCANFVESVLRAGGVRAPIDMTPGGLVDDLKQNPNP